MKIQILISNSSWVSSEYKKKFLSKLKKYSKKIFFTDTHLRLKKNYDLVITRADVITVSKNIDITAEVMKELDSRLKTVKVNR